MRNSSSFQAPRQDLHIARPARRAEWPEPRKVVATLRGWRNGEAAPDEVPGSAGLPRVLAEPDADPVAVASDGIEQQCEVTIKEGRLYEQSNNSSGQERHYRGKFVCAPWLSKWLNKIRFLAGSADSAVDRLFYRR